MPPPGIAALGGSRCPAFEATFRSDGRRHCRRHTVLSATDGQGALEILQQRSKRVHLVLTDVVMPGMSGPELLSRIREEHPECKGLYMSGYSDKSLFPDHPLSEAPLIQKPFSPGALAQQVREILDLPAARRLGAPP